MIKTQYCLTCETQAAEIERLRETIVELWHHSNADHGTLRECLNMTVEEYATWLGGCPDAAITAMLAELETPSEELLDAARVSIHQLQAIAAYLTAPK